MPPNPDPLEPAPTEAETLRRLGERLARERLRRNLTQAALADEAGVSRATVSRLEQGESTQLANLVRILRALGLVANLESLAPEPEASPLELAERHGRERRRASSPRSGRERGAGAWTWGEDR